jgi:hypothetical protein
MGRSPQGINPGTEGEAGSFRKRLGIRGTEPSVSQEPPGG